MTKPNENAPAGNATAPQAPKRRTRGPNKPKPASLLEVRVDATMSQSAIAKVLTDYVTQEQDGETAAVMELQVQGSEEARGWIPANDHSAKIRFATKGSR